VPLFGELDPHVIQSGKGVNWPGSELARVLLADSGSEKARYPRVSRPLVNCGFADLRIFKRVKCGWFCGFFCTGDG